MKKKQLSEDLRRMQELAGIITEAKSNDYYKKGMMSQNEGEAYGGYEDIMPKQRLGILQQLLDASIKDKERGASGPKTQEVIDHLKQAIEALKGNMALSENKTYTFILQNKGGKKVDINAPNMEAAGEQVVTKYPNSDPMLTHEDGKEIKWNKGIVRREGNTLKEQPSDPRFKHQPADEAMLANVKAALGNINQRALTRDIANLVLQSEINLNEDGDIVIRFYSKPRK